MKNVAATRGQNVSLTMLLALWGRVCAGSWAKTATVLNSFSLALLKEVRSQKNRRLFATIQVSGRHAREKATAANTFFNP
jgi:hypothetical protein